MADVLSPFQRSLNMSRIRAKDTKPEIIVRKMAHALGYRFRLHRKDLPGSPDLVFASRHKIIFVHGCFWHRHPGCPKSTLPKTRRSFWQEKFKQNTERDVQVTNKLKAGDWEVLVIWECETTNSIALASTIDGFLRN